MIFFFVKIEFLYFFGNFVVEDDDCVLSKIQNGLELVCCLFKIYVD